MSRVFRSIHNLPAKLPLLTGAVVKSEVVIGDERVLKFSARVQGSNGSEKPYRVEIACKYVPEPNVKKALVVPVKENKQDVLLCLAKPPNAKSKFQVSCTCQDYLFTYSRQNYEQGYHFGPKLKVPKASGGGTPRNPKNKSGCCKHVMMLQEALVRLKYIR